MKITTEDGTELEVSADQVELTGDDPFLTQEQVDDVVSSRVKRAKRTTRESLKEDDDFFAKAAKARGIELREDGQPKGALKDEAVQELKRKASKVDALTEQVRTYESQIEDTRVTQLENEVLKHADGIQTGAEEDVVQHVRSRMTYDDDYGWAMTGDDGLQYDAGQPVGVSQAVDQVRKSKPFLFSDRSAQDGPSGSPGSGGHSGGKKVWTSDEHASADPVNMDTDTYTDWVTAAEEDRIQ